MRLSKRKQKKSYQRSHKEEINYTNNSFKLSIDVTVLDAQEVEKYAINIEPFWCKCFAPRTNVFIEKRQRKTVKLQIVVHAPWEIWLDSFRNTNRKFLWHLYKSRRSVDTYN